jgi:starch-binding outer membrane protein, SusD/RagB family
MKTKERNSMKKSLYLIRVAMILLGVAVFSQSCTKLDEKLYSEVTPSNFFKSDAEFVSALGAAYTQLGGYASGDVNNLQETTTDEMVVPTRGSDWDDGGNWRRLHLHSWKFEDNAVSSAWGFCFSGVSTANRLIYQFTTLANGGQVNKDVAAAYISELQALRSFFYWQLVDLYGNVPYDNDFANASPSPTQVPRATVFGNIVTDLEAATTNMTKTVDGTTYGRMNYFAAKFLLAKLYLNSGVYSGTAQWDKCIAACDEIINSGKYSLEGNYFANFNVNNSSSKEFIFAIPYDKVFFTGFNMNAQTLHYASQFTYNLTFQPWNGFCTLEQFYKSYDATDIRRGDVGTATTPASKRGNFLAGYQFKNGGGVATDDGADGADPDGKPVNFGNIGDLVGGNPAPQINEVGPAAWRQSGVRIGKWEFEVGGTSDMSNDFGVFRYADVLLMKAEAQWRKSQSATDANALTLVNQVRSRAGLTALASLDGKLSFDPAGATVAGGELFNEMGREMVFEHNRRQDLIRWGFWNSNAKWTLPFHNVGDQLNTVGEYLKLYPIPKAQLAANPSLVQNPGY